MISKNCIGTAQVPDFALQLAQPIVPWNLGRGLTTARLGLLDPMPQYLRVNLHEIADSTDHANTVRVLCADVEHHAHRTFHDLGRIPALSGHVVTSKPFGTAGLLPRTAAY